MSKQQTPTLELKIANALADTNADSTALGNLLVECEDGIKDAEQRALKIKDEAFDPQLYPDPKAARELIEDSAFEANRLRTLMPRLEHRLKVVSEHEECDRFREKYESLRPRRDALAAELKEAYEAIPALVDVLKRMAALKTEIDSLNRDKPSAVNFHLHGTEAVARGLTDFDGHASIISRLQLPDFSSDSMLYPPPKQLDPSLFQPQPFSRKYSGDWWMDSAEAQEEKRKEAVRLAQEAETARQAFWRPRA